MSYTLTADQVPAAVIAATFLDPEDATPTTGPTLPTGTTTGLSTRFDKLSAMVDALGREGAGGRCINRGLIPSDSGDPLTVAVSAGQASIDGPVTLADGGSCVVSDDIYDSGDPEVRIHLWVTQSRTVTPVNNSLTPPSTNCVYLGSCRTSGGEFVDFDLSGRMMRLQGGPLYRRTADPGEPADTPPSTISFWAETDGGHYLWTGSAWVEAGVDAKTVLTSGSHSTAGPLEDVLAEGDGIALSVEETSPGVWQLVITNTALTPESDFSTVVLRDGSQAFTSNQSMGGNKLTAVGTPTNSTDAATKGYADTVGTNAVSAAASATSDLVKRDGTRAFTDNQSMGGNKLTNVGAPASGGDAANKTYVDNAVSGFSTTDRNVRVSSGDTAPGSLSEKITTTSDLSATVDGAPASDQSLLLGITPHAETLTGMSFDLPRGGKRLVWIDWSARGLFKCNANSAQALFFFRPTSTGGPADTSLVVHEVVWTSGLQQNGYGADASPERIRGGGGTLLLVEDQGTYSVGGGYSAHPYDTVTITLEGVAVGFGWVAGVSPSATPNVMVFEDFGRTVDHFDLTVAVSPGEKRRYRCDFSGRGYFSDDFQVRLQPDQDGIACTVLDSYRKVNGWDGDGDGSFEFDVEMASDATDTAGDPDETVVRVTLQGNRFYPVNLAVTPTATEVTDAYPSLTLVPTTEEVPISVWWPDAPSGTGIILMRWPVHRDVTIGDTATLAISRAWCQTRPTSAGEISICDFEPGVGSTIVGSISFDSASDDGTFDFADPVTISAGHHVLFVTAAGAEDPMAGIAINLVGLVALA